MIRVLVIALAAAAFFASSSSAAAPAPVRAILTAGGYALTHDGFTSKRDDHHGRVAIDLAGAPVARAYAALYALNEAPLERQLREQWHGRVEVTRVRAVGRYLVVDVTR